jgi:hypothetical protein
MRFSHFIAVLVIAVAVTTPSFAQELRGWCLPADDCMGEQIKIGQGRFDTCEETCELKKPVRINGMNAYAYDLYCRGDMGSTKSRVIIAQTASENGTTRYYISNSFVSKLERCN